MQTTVLNWIENDYNIRPVAFRMEVSVPVGYRDRGDLP